MKDSIISKDELKKYYIDENHTFKECLSHFQITAFRFYALMHAYGLEKPSLKVFLQQHTRDEVYELYIINDMSWKELVNYLDTTPDILRSAMSKWGINKPSESAVKKSNLLQSINLEDFYRYYVIENHSQEETCVYFNIEHCDIIKIIKNNNLYKYTPSLSYTSSKVVDSLISKEDLYAYYILENHRISECEAHYNVNAHQIHRLLKKYGIKKSQDKIWELTAQRKLSNSKTLGNPKKFDSYPEEFRKMWNDPTLSLEFLDKEPRYTARELANKFGCNTTTIFNWSRRVGLREYIRTEASHYEQELYEFLVGILPNTKVKRNVRLAAMHRKELDIYIPDLKIAIEFNGIYWHSKRIKQDKKYHFNKSILCQNAGIRLIHIYEHEWCDLQCQEKLKSLLRIACGVVDSKIYARQCEIREISNTDARKFNEENHLQGHRNAQVTYGLFYKNELVQLMSFSKTRYNRNLRGDNDWEIIRGCPGSNNIVVGGVSKLFKRFVDDYNPKSIFSYCDFNKFDGRGYEILGMKFIGYTVPNRMYVINGEVYNRNPKRYKEYKEKAEYIIFGVGSKKYLWMNNLYKEQGG